MLSLYYIKWSILKSRSREAWIIGFWFARLPAANACQKTFVSNCVGDFGLLLGNLGVYWITGSFEFQDLFEILNKTFEILNEVNFSFVTLCTALLFASAVAKSAQFPLHEWLPYDMCGHHLLPLFMVIPYIMNLISLVGIITRLLGSTLARAQ